MLGAQREAGFSFTFFCFISGCWITLLNLNLLPSLVLVSRLLSSNEADHHRYSPPPNTQKQANHLSQAPATFKHMIGAALVQGFQHQPATC